jgi:MFS family permease
MSPSEQADPLARQRRLALVTYFTAVALTSLAYVATFQNASVLAPIITGSASTGGLPSSAEVAGSAIAAAMLATLMAARGRRVGILTGLAVAIIGSAMTVAAVATWSFGLLIAGVLVIGSGNAAATLSRYAAADMVPPARRAAAVGIVVWGSTIGAVAGPNLVAPANRIGESLGWQHATGGFAMAVGFLILAVAVVALGPRPPASPDEEIETGVPAERASMWRLLTGLLSSVRGRTAVLALVSGQLVMVLIMTMTPYHLSHAGYPDSVVGIVVSAHMFGMFALSPVSGRLTERLGAVPVILLGFAGLATAGLLAAMAPAGGGTVLMLPLFLLGYSWNLSFVAGSSLLATGQAFRDRARLQGLIDALAWGTAALAGVVAGPVVAGLGYAVLCLGGTALAVLLAALFVADGRRLEAAGTTS